MLQLSSVSQSCLTLCDPMDCIMPGFPVHHQLSELTQTHAHRVCDAIQQSHPLSAPSPPAFNFSSIRVFSNESVLHIRWPKYWNFSFSISLSSDYSGLISLRIDWLELITALVAAPAAKWTLSDPMDCSPPGCSIYGIFQARVLEWGAIAFSALQPLRTLKSLVQHHSWKASILLHSAFFTVQLSHTYMTIGKTIALTRQTFVGKVSAF